ncbi:lactate dehydrogenase-like 2-hydroxyacid dehydrogenase [Propionicimonas paludicola]|uniref:Lactate dehydrogenase-like 2-hydroxyacid dehydrogenase n=1 Tax=Propionicimonas paludicola TaxID=185243 RepID=A0A2A9CP65_9ACTN|nr:NAD(P)-dependent oxidoreductase [Propionicimonas paludicola]PFG15991.1 lactate dehydrogenase-like 2-hydroxyacid dehydrogenase [Propionicimonas paludicola]
MISPTRLAQIGELPLRPAELGRLAELAGGTLAEAGPDTEVALISTATPLTEDALARLPALRHLALCGTSYGRIDIDAIQRRGISTSNVADYSDETTAEVIFMQLVAVARGYAPVQWRAESHELFGKRLLIVGLGALGSAVAHLGLAYGMQVAHLSRSAKPEWEAKGVRRAVRPSAFGEADVVVVTGPTGAPLISADDLARLHDAILLQASGGRVIDDAAFRDWITRGHNVAIFDLAAGEDVFADYAELPRVVFPRAISGLSDESRQRLGEQVIANVEAAMGRA